MDFFLNYVLFTILLQAAAPSLLRGGEANLCTM